MLGKCSSSIVIRLGVVVLLTKAFLFASFYPLSIVMVGVGDGPWKEMQPADECIPARAFYNFQVI